MFIWILSNYKAVIAFAGALVFAAVTYVISPFFAAGATFVVSTTQLKASVVDHTDRIDRIERVVYGMDAKFDLIQSSLKIIEERSYQELKEARQKRLAK